jgi:hypothetical protein
MAIDAIDKSDSPFAWFYGTFNQMIRYSLELLIRKVVEMIVRLNDGIIAAMPEDPVSGGYDKQGVFTVAAASPQASVTSLRQVDPVDCHYDACHVFHQPASPPLASQPSPLAYQRPVAVLSLRRHAERFYAARLAGRSLGPHIFLRHK